MAYIVIDRAADGTKIDPIVMMVDTDDQRDTARVALKERGIAFERVSVGDPEDPDSYQTSERLYAWL